MSPPAVAVIGAGNVGCALAGDLALRGADVRLFNRSPERLEPIRRAGGVTVTGEVEGFARLRAITSTLPEAVDGADVVAVTLPTSCLPAYSEALLEAASEEQIIWLNPGHSGGALFLGAEARRTVDRPRKLCQLTTASHISRMTGPAAVRVFLRARASVAALPPDRLDECYDALDALLPGQFGRVDSVLEADLMNINGVLHPPGMVCNAGWIEATDGAFGFYADGNAPSVARVMDAVDRERASVASALGVPTVSLSELLKEFGFTSAGLAPDASARTAIESCALIHPIKAPPTLDHRYLHEDVGWGLVPWMHLAAAADCRTPTISGVTLLAGLINGVDYSREGLTLEAMGLAGKDVDEIRAYVGVRGSDYVVTDQSAPGRGDAAMGSPA